VVYCYLLSLLRYSWYTDRLKVIYCYLVILFPQLEIDEFQDYEKALGAMGEAYKCLSKLQANDSQAQTDAKMNDIKSRMLIMNRFLKIKRYNFSLCLNC